MSCSKDTLCILPFIHLYAEPNGEMKPCCIADGFDDSVNLRNTSIEKAFNSPQMKQLRKDMLEGKRNKVCNVCYQKEDLHGTSPRFTFNSNTLWHMPDVKADFSVPTEFQHIDIRFSNLCNFKCRMCNHSFSSNWYEDSQKIYPGLVDGKPKVMKVSDTIIEDLKPHIKNVKSFYFAGGEPLIMPEHFKILKYLYDTLPIVEQHWGAKRNLSIHYNTNLSNIKYEEQSLIDLWQGFNRVFLSISCDGVEKVGEYQRIGFSHDKFVSNLKNIKKYFRPDSSSSISMGLLYNFQYTTTIYNVYHIFDFIKFMKKNKFIESTEQIDFYYAWVPYHIALNNIDDFEKKNIIKFLKKGIKKLSNYKTINEINNLITFIESEQNIKNTEPIVHHTFLMDEINNTDIRSIGGVDFDGMLTRNKK